MPANVVISLGTLYGFLLVLARVSGAFIFVPLPGFTSNAGPARVALSLGFTLALRSYWPAMTDGFIGAGQLVAWAIAEAAVGIAIGVAVAIVLEAFGLAAQILGMQAGYGYASTVDPNSQADSGILLVVAQLVSGLLFFAMGLDREVLRLFARSLEKVPPGSVSFSPAAASGLIALGSELFSVGVRIALPVITLLLLVDIALALLGRLNSQLQLISLAFPAKMLAALVLLSCIAPLLPKILRDFSVHAWSVAGRVLGL